MSNRNRCAACRFHGRRCSEYCIFSPYFPSAARERFESVNRIHGVDNVGRMLQDTPVQLREDAVETLLFEARARIHDPVHGCVGMVFRLQQEILVAQRELAMTRARLAFYRAQAAQENQTKAEDVEALSFSDPGQDSFWLDEPLPEFDEISKTSFEDDKSDG